MEDGGVGGVIIPIITQGKGFGTQNISAINTENKCIVVGGCPVDSQAVNYSIWEIVFLENIFHFLTSLDFTLSGVKIGNIFVRSCVVY